MKRNLNLLLVVAMTLFVVLGSTARARMVFMERFEYAVGRSDPNAAQIFTGNGWSHVKTQQSHSGNANGYLYTVSSIPGFSGSFPGTNSTRVLAIEALPGSMQGQTDFYLALGNGSSAAFDDHIPGDVWFQFWIYPQNYGSQLSRYGTRNKFIYACNGSYPCSSQLWMLSQGAPTYNRSNLFPLGDPARGEFFMNVSSASGPSDLVNLNAEESNQDMIGPTNMTDWMRPNRWTLVKMHFNTTSTTGNSWEMWVRPYGGAWTKTSEWIGGRTPGFRWDIPSASVGGHREIRMPTTIGSPTSQWYDYWMYMDDFAMATTEQDLTVYPDERNVPRAPTNLRIIGSALLDGSLLLSPGTVLERLWFNGSEGH